MKCRELYRRLLKTTGALPNTTDTSREITEVIAEIEERFSKIISGLELLDPKPHPTELFRIQYDIEAALQAFCEFLEAKSLAPLPSAPYIISLRQKMGTSDSNVKSIDMAAAKG